MSISQTIYDFTTLAIHYGGWMELDRIYLQNRLLGMIGEDSLGETIQQEPLASSVELMDQLMVQAEENKVVGTSHAEREILAAQLMDLLTPPPSVINALFAQHYSKSPQEATDYFYQLSRINNYIHVRSIAKNTVFSVPTEFGDLEITINLSKPEKDPKDIAAARRAKKTTHYPQCLLCMENEGYKGRLDYPARTNHRIIRMNLDGESWGFQYSPYAYFNEHCIFLAEKHRPMAINSDTFRRLLRIVEIFPHYMVGSNSDLPIVGGSILTHDHFQGGRHEFPMAKAPVEDRFAIKRFPQITAGIVKWPMSVIRLKGKDKAMLVDAATHILKRWREYSSPDLSIIAYTEDGMRHHTITPIARKKGDKFELDLVLRDNNTAKEFPDGIFHPHPEREHIKKENIGLIEVMGLAILPPRLATELPEVEKFVLDQPNHIKDYHRPWAEEIKKKYKFTPENAQEIVQQETGQIFGKALEDAGVFKRNTAGKQAFRQFIDTL
ncbi:MAG: UDP-glucose--hexose-1-phosphate uridylyltransferase [Enterococcaceae bacterium]|jgi:UDPglucose--hexose-1-phosphate uridylyltransferase|nr:UDP-glucose--hexose-1-phosphate uridylyltransferase [Enterococcaceae bacterium]MCI1918830.1 UDP-glucose--hexose-1-phosphate uridylyltransferase [Enterococcaceae bacterium]